MTHLKRYIMTGKCDNFGVMLRDILLEAEKIENRMKTAPGYMDGEYPCTKTEWEVAGDSLSYYICSMDAVDKFGICEEDHDVLWLGPSYPCREYGIKHIERFKHLNRFLLSQMQERSTR